MEIKRDFCLNKLIQHKKNGMVKIITGIRGCDKSYLLFKLFRDHLLESGINKDHIISIALDNFGNRKLQNPDELYNYVKRQIVANRRKLLQGRGSISHKEAMAKAEKEKWLYMKAISIK